MSNEITILTAAISMEGRHPIDKIIAESAMVKRLREAGHGTSKSTVWKASTPYMPSGPDMLEKDPVLLARTDNPESAEFAPRMIQEDVEG